jgi:hypothetical protein
MSLPGLFLLLALSFLSGSALYTREYHPLPHVYYRVCSIFRGQIMTIRLCL